MFFPDMFTDLQMCYLKVLAMINLMKIVLQNCENLFWTAKATQQQHVTFFNQNYLQQSCSWTNVLASRSICEKNYTEKVSLNAQ